MAEITVQMGALDAEKSVIVANVATATLAGTTTIANALENKNNSLHIIINANAGGIVTIKAGNAYPNAILGDLPVNVATGLNDIMIVDAARFENKDGSIVIETTVAGTICAVAKNAGIDKV